MATTFHLYLRKDFQKQNGEFPIYLRITHNRKHKYISSQLSVLEKDWNQDKQEFRKTRRNSKTLNQTLRSKVLEAEKAYLELLQQDKDSAKNIRDRLSSNQKTDFFELADEFETELIETKKLYALKTAKVVFKKLERFQGERSLPLKHIDTEFLEKFEEYLRKNYGNSNTTINKNFEPIRAIIKQALKGRMLYKDPFALYEGVQRGKPKKKVKLTLEQIRAIEALDLKLGAGLWHTRNAFMFSFYSGGIRFGDICCLKWENVKNGRLSYVMNKNDKPFSTGLNHYQEIILSNYSGAGHEYIFPFLKNNVDYSDPMVLRKAINGQNVTANKHLGKIANALNEHIDTKEIKVPKIKESLTFHVSRHSFAQYAVQSGLGVYELMQALRHSKIETTEQYLKGLDEELADKAMNKVF